MKKHAEHLFLVGLVFVSFLLRFPSLFEPYWYGDEGIYQVIGRATRSGALLYQDIWDNKPPALYLLYALVNGDQFWARLLSLLFLLGGVLAFYFLAKKLFTKLSTVISSTVFFALLFSLPLLEGNIANAENFMLLPIILAALLVFNYALYPKPSTLILAGFLLSLAFLTKIVAIFDLTAFSLFLVFIYSWKGKKATSEVKKFAKKVWPLVAGFILPIFLTVLVFFVQGSLKDFFSAAFSQNVGYVGAENKLFIPQGLLILKLAILGLALWLLFWKRKVISKQQLFILLWLAFSLFNLFFAGRPWTHFLLVLLPSFALLVGLLLEEKRLRFLYLLLVLVILLLIPNNFWIYGKTPWYYQNFISFVKGDKPAFAYQDFFAPHVKRDYLLAQFLRGKLTDKDNVFIWGDNAQLYMLVGKLPPGRYSVAYHITFYPQAVEETKQAIKQKKPKYIVAIRDMVGYEELFIGYKQSFLIEGASIYERSPYLSEAR